jgi:hypothetical protein
MLIYTRFIRPVMPIGSVRNVHTYIAPTLEKAQRNEKLPPKLVPIKPTEMRGHASGQP